MTAVIIAELTEPWTNFSWHCNGGRRKILWVHSQNTFRRKCLIVNAVLHFIGIALTSLLKSAANQRRSAICLFSI
jgi:hypothetical protein